MPPNVIEPMIFVVVLVALSGCGGKDGDVSPRISYHPHVVLDLQTEIDADGNPDIADPVVIKVDGTWYLYATQTKADLHVWTSTDLENWTRKGPVWKPTPGTWNSRGQVWAPHVEAAPEGYFLYYTADMQIGVAVSDSPEGPFVEVFDHPLVGGGFGGMGDGKFDYDPDGGPYDYQASFIIDFEEKAIDAFVLRTNDGSLFLYFSAYDPLSSIVGVPMQDWTTVFDEAPTVLLSPDPLGWEGFVTEGAWVVEHDRRYHLMYSGNGADRPMYSIGVAVSDEPLGKFVRYADNPIFAQQPDKGLFGPGHHCLVEGAFDDTLMFYHSKVSAEQAFDRRIRYAPVVFDAGGEIALGVPFQ